MQFHSSTKALFHTGSHPNVTSARSILPIWHLSSTGYQHRTFDSSAILKKPIVHPTCTLLFRCLDRVKEAVAFVAHAASVINEAVAHYKKGARLGGTPLITRHLDLRYENLHCSWRHVLLFSYRVDELTCSGDYRLPGAVLCDAGKVNQPRNSIIMETWTRQVVHLIVSDLCSC